MIKLFSCLFHSSYWSSSQWIHVYLIHLNWSEISPIKSLLLQKKHFGFTAGCIPYIHMAYLCIWCWVWQKLMWRLCMDQRTLTESSGLCFWILGSSESLGIGKLVFIWFSRLWLAHCYFTEITRTFSWNFYLLCIKLVGLLLCIKLVGLLPCSNISPVDKMIFKIWKLLFSQKPDDEYIHSLITILFKQ